MNKRPSLGFTPSGSRASRRFLPLAPTVPLSPCGPQPHTRAPSPPRLPSDPTSPGRAPFSSYSSALKPALPREHLLLRSPPQPPPQYLPAPGCPPLPSGAAAGPGPQPGAFQPFGPRPSDQRGRAGGAHPAAAPEGRGVGGERGRVPYSRGRRLAGPRAGGGTAAWVSALDLRLGSPRLILRGSRLSVVGKDRRATPQARAAWLRSGTQETPKPGGSPTPSGVSPAPSPTSPNPPLGN